MVRNHRATHLRHHSVAATPRRALALLLALSPLFTLTGCFWMKSTSERMTETRSKITDNYRQELQRQMSGRNGQALDIGWKKALEKMYFQNPNLIQADFRIEDARVAQKQIWRNMVPGLNIGMSDSFRVRDIGDAFSNPSFRINSFISLGNLLDLPKSVYSRKLAYIGAELNAEQSMRQEVIQLYKLFQEQRLLRLQKRAIDLEGQLVSNIGELESSEIILLRLQHKKSLEDWEEAMEKWQTKVGDFFMTSNATIQLRTDNLPDITYDPSTLDFTNTARWGLLQLNLLALEDIAEQGKILETYLRYVPRANLTLNAPSLYSNNSDNSFDPSLTSIYPSVYWSLDSRGYISQQIRRLKREKPLRDWRKDKRQREEITQLLKGKEKLAEIRKELRTVRGTIKGYKQIVREGLVDDPKNAVITMRSLREKEIRLLAKEIDICSQFWLIDEYRWKPITKRWLQTRESRTRRRKKMNKNAIKRPFPKILPTPE